MICFCLWFFKDKEGDGLQATKRPKEINDKIIFKVAIHLDLSL